MTSCADPPTDGGECAPTGDYRSRPRRRGDELNAAIYRATLEELTEVGYRELTMDRIAARAKASKGSLYRRWPSRTELVVDAVRNIQTTYAAPPDSGDLRAELVQLLRDIADYMAGPGGEAMRGLVSEVARSPELLRVVRAEVMDSALPPMLEVLRRGVVRHEVRPDALTPLVARVGISLLRQRYMFSEELEAGFIDEVVDQVVLPLVRAHPSA
jgi:AcrR family transcriptional regulator